MAPLASIHLSLKGQEVGESQFGVRFLAGSHQPHTKEHLGLINHTKVQMKYFINSVFLLPSYKA